MRLVPFGAILGVMLLAGAAGAAEISGEYLEARTCDVYTGPCFANAEMGLAGKEAVMAWKVDEGSWNGVALDGLGVAVVVNAQGTLGSNVFPMKAGEIKSIILVDERASQSQQTALVNFAKDAASEYTENVVAVKPTTLELTNNHLEGRGVFKAGEIATIETRSIQGHDCVCTNELVYYNPLTDVDNTTPAFTQELSYTGDGFNRRWTNHSLRSAFLGTFSR